jgi:hypothetical protein
VESDLGSGRGLRDGDFPFVSSLPGKPFFPGSGIDKPLPTFRYLSAAGSSRNIAETVSRNDPVSAPIEISANLEFRDTVQNLHTLDVSVPAVKARIHRARKSLARLSTTEVEGPIRGSTGILTSKSSRDMPEL